MVLRTIRLERERTLTAWRVMTLLAGRELTKEAMKK